jgi:hypothetical protein
MNTRQETLITVALKGDPFPGKCPECGAIVPWNNDTMTCWNCALRGDSELFNNVEWKFRNRPA